ncbi:MAG TPA: radical SAM protein [Blastocatellia bacterium]|nr:radical SAM protein [Blastocatellia bacterium]
MTVKTTADLPASTIYGPVKSWRLGASLGVDLLYVNSICSFKCLYCQLGKIHVHSNERKVFVPTERVMADLKASTWKSADVITFSGNGEPTLAANLGEAIHEIKAYTHKPIAVLTNATLLNDPKVRFELSESDQIFCKLDAADEATFLILNRPAAGITLKSIVEGIMKLRAEFNGRLAIQTMLMPLNSRGFEQLAELLRKIQPDEVQLNTPLRPAPRTWSIETRGNHSAQALNRVRLKSVNQEQARQIEKQLRERTGLKIVSVYPPN